MILTTRPGILGPIWRKLHRVLHDFLTREKCLQHLEVQEAQSAVFMRDVLENPEVRCQ